MATFTVPVLKIKEITPIEGSDFIDVATIMDYRCVIPKGKMTEDDYIVYIPEFSIVPDWILEKMNLVGKLAGTAKNRVKAIRLRGVLSQGLVLPIEKNGNDYGMTDGTTFRSFGETLTENMNVASILGIKKYEPTLPAHMAGEVFHYKNGYFCPAYDIENIKNHSNVLQNGELVEFTEKLHGTNACYAHVAEEVPESFGHWIVASKGLSAKQLGFKNNDQNQRNLYVNTGLTLSLMSKFEEAAKIMGLGEDYAVFGEIFGNGVQDLQYGFTNSEKAFCGFDVYVGKAPAGRYLDVEDRNTFFALAGLPTVPVLYCGPFSVEIMQKYTVGKETISGKERHIREGIVIKPMKERRDQTAGRVVFKNINEDYLLRKNGSEFN